MAGMYGPEIERVIWAIVPSVPPDGSALVQYLLHNGILPRTVMLTGETRTYEAALAELGRTLVGHMFSPDYAYPVNPSTLVYRAKSVDPATVNLAPDVQWSSWANPSLSAEGIQAHGVLLPEGHNWGEQA